METVAMSQQDAMRAFGDLMKDPPANAAEPLPRAPCVRLKKTGEIFDWDDAFAERPELFDACDEQGNIIGVAVPTPPPPVINTNIVRPGVHDAGSPDVTKALAMGLSRQFAQDWTEPTTAREALPLPPQQQGVTVEQVLDALQAELLQGA